MKTIAKNKKVFHNFQVEERVEAGISLTGSEVKSLRSGDSSISEAHVRIIAGEAFILGMNIPPYKAGGYANHKPNRRRKLLLHKREIKKLHSRVAERGYTILPLSVYFNNKGLVKISIGIARGKKHFDKREDMKKREMKREIERETRRRK